MYRVTKTYGHDLGLSACFRQHRAQSHCSFLHGYALQVELVFACDELNENHWVIDFGGLKDIKQFLVDHFDHKTLVAMDDPHLDEISALAGLKIADVIILPAVGCEAFAAYIRDYVAGWLEHNHADAIRDRGLRLVSVEVREHGANSATAEER